MNIQSRQTLTNNGGWEGRSEMLFEVLVQDIRSEVAAESLFVQLSLAVIWQDYLNIHSRPCLTVS